MVSLLVLRFGLVMFGCGGWVYIQMPWNKSINYLSINAVNLNFWNINSPFSSWFVEYEMLFMTGLQHREVESVLPSANSVDSLTRCYFLNSAYATLGLVVVLSQISMDPTLLISVINETMVVRGPRGR